jgi:hypothetical protein
MLRRFVTGYLLVGALISTWINVAGAMSAGETAFDLRATLPETVWHFLVAFGVPMLTWPVLVFSQLLVVLELGYRAIQRSLNF